MGAWGVYQKPGDPWWTGLPVGFANSGGLVFVDEAAEEVVTA